MTRRQARVHLCKITNTFLSSISMGPSSIHSDNVIRTDRTTTERHSEKSLQRTVFTQKESQPVCEPVTTTCGEGVKMLHCLFKSETVRRHGARKVRSEHTGAYMSLALCVFTYASF